MKFYDKLKVRYDQADSLRIGASKCAWLWDRTAAIADIMRGVTRIAGMLFRSREASAIRRRVW